MKKKPGEEREREKEKERDQKVIYRVRKTIANNIVKKNIKILQKKKKNTQQYSNIVWQIT